MEQSCRVDSYSPAKIMENRARPGNIPDWAVCGSDVTMVTPDGILRQGFIFPWKIRQVGMEKKPRERDGNGQGVAALGQPMGPTVFEGSSKQSSGQSSSLD
ncbi:hypothetical protein CRG98_006749 [Punica granatum]|uniref:Uncharacterized protein n=1 Tax=Punica granatum TaxID=22663 RepID=A0A2I0KWN8_PUNGR|nr:hypothetical protein CRG98_006749 [Punica granatum]